MQQEGFKEAVETLFEERWATAGLEKKYALDFRCKIAQELLNAEPEEIVQELREQLDAEYEEALEEYNERAERIGDPDSIDEEERGQYVC
jgi:hypothetical protein